MRCSFHFSHTNLHQAPPHEKPHTTTHFIHIFSRRLGAHAAVLMYAHLYIQVHTLRVLHSFIKRRQHRETVYRNWINKSACGVLAQINTLFSPARGLSWRAYKYQSNLWASKSELSIGTPSSLSALCVRVDKWIWIRYHSPLLKTIRSHLTFASRCLFFTI